MTSNQRYADAYNNLGIILEREGEQFAHDGKFDESERKFNDSIALHIQGLKVMGDRASDRNNLSRVYLHRRDLYLKKRPAPARPRPISTAPSRKNKASLDLDHNFLSSWMTKYRYRRSIPEPRGRGHQVSSKDINRSSTLNRLGNDPGSDGIRGKLH